MSELNHMARKQSFLLSFLLIFHSNELCLYIYVCVYYVRALLLCVCVFVSVGMNLIMDKSWLQEKKVFTLIYFFSVISASLSLLISLSLSLSQSAHKHTLVHRYIFQCPSSLCQLETLLLIKSINLEICLIQRSRPDNSALGTDQHTHTHKHIYTKSTINIKHLQLTRQMALIGGTLFSRQNK